MKMVKSLLLASAAGFVAIAGAQAADLPVKAKAVEYVKVCSLYGAGFYYIPGTDTCIKYSGFIRYEQNYNSYASGSQDYALSATPGATGNIASGSVNRDYYTQRIRVAWQTDTRTQTEYGTLRSYSYLYLTAWDGGATAASGGIASAPTLLQGYIQFAGFTVGQFKNAFFTPWSSNPGTYNGSLFYPDDAGAQKGVMYTWQFGNGVSASIGAWDPNRAGLYLSTGALTANPTAAMFANASLSGNHAPDIAGNIQVDQAWGVFQLSAMAHESDGTYYTGSEIGGHPNAKWGFAVNAGLNLKNLPTGAGDQFFLNGAYSDGLTRSQTNNSPATSIGLYSSGIAGSTGYQRVGWTYLMDGTYAPGGQINTVKMYSGQAAFEHFWIPTKLKTSLYGYGGKIDFGGAGSANNVILCSKFTFSGGAANCNFDTTFWSVGSRTTWYPVQNLEVALDVAYTQFNFANSGQQVAFAAAQVPGFKPAGVYDVRNQSVLSGALRVLRTW